MALAAYLRTLRSERGMAQREWAKGSGIHQSTLWRWEQGKTLPREIELHAALAALNASPAEQHRALALLDAEHGKGIERTALRSEIPLVHRGDLLRALRLRQGWT